MEGSLSNQLPESASISVGLGVEDVNYQVEALIRAGAEVIQALLNKPNLHCLELH